MSNAQNILRIVARANGWQVLAAEDSDTYLRPDDPAKGIEVLWAASGGVLMAMGTLSIGTRTPRQRPCVS
jgi:hypothetical protein